MPVYEIPLAPELNSPPFVGQYDILNNKWGVLLCQKGYQTNVIHQNSRNESLRQSYKRELAIRRPAEFKKFKDMAVSKVGSGFIWKKVRKDLQWNAAGEKVQVSRRSCPAK